MTPQTAAIGIDFGLSNTDIVVRDGASIEAFTIESTGGALRAEFDRALIAAGSDPRLGRATRSVRAVAVTGGRHRQLADVVDGIRVVHVDEMEAIGRGGLELAGLSEAIVVSAGTGTAIIAARPNAIRHVTGTAVGGGTMQGLARLLVGTTDPAVIEVLAKSGDPNGADLSIADAIGGAIATLPPTATAVNFGRLARAGTPTPSRADLAAALVRMVGQVISLLALNAARAEGLGDIILVGHLMDMPSMRAACDAVAALYRTRFIIPEGRGFATARGALARLD